MLLRAPELCSCSAQIAAADVLLGKIGYGTVSECLAHSTPLVFVRRDYFNEEPFLRRLLQLHGAAVEIRRRDFLEGTWAPFLLHAAELNFTYKCVPTRRIQPTSRLISPCPLKNSNKGFYSGVIRTLAP